MSQTSPFSVAAVAPDHVVAVQRGATGLAIDSVEYRVGSKRCRAVIDDGLTVTPTQMSPLRMKWSCEAAQTMSKSWSDVGFNISTTTLPLARAARSGRRTRILVSYGPAATEDSEPSGNQS